MGNFEVITFTLEKADKLWLLEAADARRMPVGDLVREMVSEGMASGRAGAAVSDAPHGPDLRSA